MSKPGPASVAVLVLATLLSVPAAAAGDPEVCKAPRRAANLGFTLNDIAGQPVRLSDYKEQVILLNFWATWCVPCKTEIPWLVEFYGAYRKQGFVVLGIAMDDAISRVRPFADALHVNYPVLLGAGEEDFQTAFAPLLGYPTSLLISRDGAICIRHTGIVDKQELERSIRALL
jgi:peroxiredoxin